MQHSSHLHSFTSPYRISGRFAMNAAALQAHAWHWLTTYPDDARLSAYQLSLPSEDACTSGSPRATYQYPPLILVHSPSSSSELEFISHPSLFFELDASDNQLEPVFHRHSTPTGEACLARMRNYSRYVSTCGGSSSLDDVNHALFVTEANRQNASLSNALTKPVPFRVHFQSISTMCGFLHRSMSIDRCDVIRPAHLRPVRPMAQLPWVCRPICNERVVAVCTPVTLEASDRPPSWTRVNVRPPASTSCLLLTLYCDTSFTALRHQQWQAMFNPALVSLLFPTRAQGLEPSDKDVSTVVLSKYRPLVVPVPSDILRSRISCVALVKYLPSIWQQLSTLNALSHGYSSALVVETSQVPSFTPSFLDGPAVESLQTRVQKISLRRLLRPPIELGTSLKLVSSSAFLHTSLIASTHEATSAAMIQSMAVTLSLSGTCQDKSSSSLENKHEKKDLLNVPSREGTKEDQTHDTHTGPLYFGSIPAFAHDRFRKVERGMKILMKLPQDVKSDALHQATAEVEMTLREGVTLRDSVPVSLGLFNTVSLDSLQGDLQTNTSSYHPFKSIGTMPRKIGRLSQKSSSMRRHLLGDSDPSTATSTDDHNRPTTGNSSSTLSEEGIQTLLADHYSLRTPTGIKALIDNFVTQKPAVQAKIAWAIYRNSASALKDHRDPMWAVIVRICGDVRRDTATADVTLEEEL